ncbi:arsenate reductase ArsC [Guggenheimella bovis]
MNKKIAFVCVHNSCRSQIAEAFSRLYLEDFECYSAGTIKSKLNEDAVRIMKEHYGIDMMKDQYSKLLTEIPAVDIVITMGCDVVCPVVSNEYHEDWGLEDPTGKDDEVFLQVIETIREKVLELKKKRWEKF